MTHSRLWILLTTILLFVGSLSAVNAHDVHIGYCRATLMGTSFEGKVTYYVDDLSKAFAIWRTNNWKREFNNTARDTWIDFLRENFRISLQTVPAKEFEIVSSGLDGSSFWFQFSAVISLTDNEVQVHNTMLVHEFADQMNMLIVTTTSGEQSHIFTASDTSATITR